MGKNMGEIVSKPYPVRWFTVPVAGLAAATTVVAGSFFNADWYWAVAPLVCAAILSMVITKRFSIDCAKRVVRSESLLFSLRVIKRKSWPLAEFEAINYTNGWIEEEVSVGIRHRSGRVLWLRDFPAGMDRRPGRDAEEFAEDLSSVTGLEINERVRSTP